MTLTSLCLTLYQSSFFSFCSHCHNSAWDLIHAEVNLPMAFSFHLSLSVSFCLSISVCLLLRAVVLCSSGGVWHPLEKEAQAQLWWPVPLATKIPQIDICKPSGPCVCGCVFGCLYRCRVYIMLRMSFNFYATLQNVQASVIFCHSALFNHQNTSEHKITHLHY